jgi:cell division protein FtsL
MFAAPLSRKLPAPGSVPRRERARPRHLRVAPEVARRRRLTRLAMFGFGVVTVASLFALVAFHVFAVQSTFTLDRIAKARTNEELRNERLRAQVATLSSPASIIARAEQLGMTNNGGFEFVQAPKAAPKRASSDPAQQAFAKSWMTTKRHLGDNNP